MTSHVAHLLNYVREYCSAPDGKDSWCDEQIEDIESKLEDLMSKKEEDISEEVHSYMNKKYKVF